jgi:hypothetical protein
MPVVDFKSLTALALAFVLAQAWGESANASVRSLFPNDGSTSARVAFAYAVLVTIVVIFLVAVINHTSRVVDGFRNKITTKTKSSTIGPAVRW